MKLSSGMSNRALATAIALMIVCTSFVVIVTAPSSQAAFPAMNEGDKWALKGERDLTLSYSTINDLFSIGSEENWLRNASLKGAGFSGNVGSAAVFEVVDVTASEYVIKMTAAQNLSLAAMLSIEGEMALPGLYISDWYTTSLNPDNLKNLSEAATMKGPFGVDAELVLGANETVTFHVQKSTMAVKTVEMDLTAYARGHIVVNNFPNITDSIWDSTNNRYLMNITSYESFDSNISLDLSLSAAAEFDPYLEIITDSPSEGSTWTQDTYVNGTMNWNGVFDVTGLPTNITDMLFGADLADWGITGFPIDLATIYNPDSSGPQINNGTLEIDTAMIDPTFANARNDTVEGTAFGAIFVNEMAIALDGSSDHLTFLYYPEKGYIVGTKVMLPIMDGMSLTLTMDSVPVSEAQDMVGSIADQVKKDAPFDAVNAGTVAAAGFVFPMDLLIILLVVVTSLVVMLGYVYVKVYMRKPQDKA